MLADKETMNLETASSLYDVKLSTLRLMCVKGEVKSKKVGNHRYVTPSEMDRVFKGEVTGKAKAKSASK